MSNSRPSRPNMAHKTAEFDSLVEETMKEWHVPGLAIAVIQGEEIYTKVGIYPLTFPKCSLTRAGVRSCPA